MTRDAAALSPPVLLQARGLVKHFPVRKGLFSRVRGQVRAVDGVDLTLVHGETLGVVGESGCGKSTLGRMLLRLIEPTRGELQLDGKDLMGLDATALRAQRRDMQLIFQDPYSSLNPRKTVGQTLQEPLRVHGLHRGAEALRVTDLLHTVGLPPEAAQRYPHEFSGGQRQRISIARAAVLEPNFVVLDEPTSALDMLFQAQMVDLLRELQRKRDLTYMFISHDLRVVASLASHLIVMRHGKVVEEGPAAELFRNPKSDYTRALFAAAFRIEAAPVGTVAT